MDHSPEESLAIRGVFCGIQDVLMPELIEVVASIGIEPRHQHEFWLFLEKRQKTDIFCLSGVNALQGPAVFFKHRIAHGN